MDSEVSKSISTSFIQIDGDTAHYAVNNLAEGKFAMKELKLKKKEFGVRKRELVAVQREIRAAYTHEVRNRGSMLRGCGGFGRFVRAFQTASRDSKRAGLAKDLAPLERGKRRIEIHDRSNRLANAQVRGIHPRIRALGRTPPAQGLTIHSNVVAAPPRPAYTSVHDEHLQFT